MPINVSGTPHEDRDGNYQIRLGSDDGTNSVQVVDVADTPVFGVNSDGEIVDLTAPETVAVPTDLFLFLDATDGQVKGLDYDQVTGRIAYVTDRAQLDTALADTAVTEIRLPPGVFDLTADNIVLARDDITIRGAGKPRFTAGTLTDGTVIQGGIYFGNNHRIEISDLGIDVSATVGTVDAINFGTTSGDGHVIRNVAMLGKNVAHACLANAGVGHRFTGLSAWNFNHGLIFKCTDSIASDLFFQDITLFALGFVADLRDVTHNTVVNVVSKDCSRAVGFESDGFWLRYNTVTNVVDDNSNYGITFIDATAAGATTCESNTVVNMVSRSAAIQACRWQDCGDDNTIIGFHAIDATNSFVAVGATVNAVLQACTSTNSTGAHATAFTGSTFIHYDVIEDGVTNLNIGGGTITSTVGLNTQTGTTYTLVAADQSSIVEMNNAGANTLTIPPNSAVGYPIGTRIDVVQFGAGTTSIDPGAGVTLNGGTATLAMSGTQYEAVTLYKRGVDDWVAVGALA